MKVLQIIDSLKPGGAEQMAISYANALAGCIEASYLCCTRKEGLLKKKLSSEVGFLFLKKKSSLDLNALFRLRNFISKKEINIIHAHSSSFFLAVLVKWSSPGVKLVWHDHFGEELKKRKAGMLKPFSNYFDGIISVNANLQQWAQQQLYSKDVRYIRNFLPIHISEFKRNSIVKGKNTFKIVCLANLRPQKDHLNLLTAFTILLQKDWAVSLHLIGKGESEQYSEEINRYIKGNNLDKNVFLYGEQFEVEGFLRSAYLGVLSSSSEGLPLALLEYGKAGLPVVCTNVGQCPEVIGEFGKIVNSDNPEELAAAIVFYMENNAARKQDAQAFHEKIMAEYSENAIMPEVLEFYEGVMM